MAKQTVTAFFDDRENANRAVLLLRRYAIPDRDVTVSPEAAATGYAEETSAHAKDFWTLLDELFGASDHRHAYAEGVRRGHVLVTAHVDDANVDEVIAILERHGSLDLGACENAWRAEGWAGGPTSAEPSTDASPSLAVKQASRAETEAAAAGVLSTPSAAGAYRTPSAQAGAANKGRARLHPYARQERPGPPSTAAFIHASVVQRAKGMEVVGSDGQPVGAIERVDGTVLAVKNLTMNDRLYLIPTGWVQTIDGRVTLKLTGAQVRSRWTAA